MVRDGSVHVDLLQVQRIEEEAGATKLAEVLPVSVKRVASLRKRCLSVQQIEVLKLGRDHIRQRRAQDWESARALDCSGESSRSNSGLTAPPLTFCHVEREAKRGENLLDVIQGTPRVLRGDHGLDIIEVRQHGGGLVQEAEAGADSSRRRRPARTRSRAPAISVANSAGLNGQPWSTPR